MMGKSYNNPSSSDTYAFHTIKPSQEIKFIIDNEDILIINKEGFTYRGELIEDSGKAYDVFMKVMCAMELTK
jgi:hypothetical protein